MPALPYGSDLGSDTSAEVGGVRRLRCGEAFDVLRVPEPAGRWALGRLLGYGQPALRPGPVALETDRNGGELACLFFVAPGAKEDLPELLDWLDWGGIDLGLRAYGEGETIPRPTRWLSDPRSPAPEVIALLATIAECCSRRLLRPCLPHARRRP